MSARGIREGTHHANPSAQTGSPQPNMSTTFMGRSRADELECSEMPKSAEPGQESQMNNLFTNASGKDNRPSNSG